MTTDLKTAVLTEGLDDWVHLLAIDFAAQRLHPSLGQGERQELIIDVVEQLLSDVLAEAGTVTENGGFVALHEPTSDVIQRVRVAFLDDNPNMWGYAVWLNNTPAGDALARAAEAVPGS
jgi:hypothetical protein